jgi:hypothetical protein
MPPRWRGADGFLEILDRFGDGRGRDADGRCRRHDLARFRGGDEIADLADVEAHRPLWPYSDFPKF